MQGFHRRDNVADDAYRQILQRLRRDGMLEVVVNVILDHVKYLDGAMLALLHTNLLADAKTLAAFHAAQGAASEMEKLARILWALGDPQEAVPLQRLRETTPTARTDV